MQQTESCSQSRMRSQTSRGVPEWSEGKELYMGSKVSAIGKISGVTGIVPGPPEGSRGSTRWGRQPRRTTWANSGKGPAPRWAGAPPTKAQGASKRGGGQTLGQMGPKAHPRCAFPSPPCGRHPDGIWGAAATPREGTLDGGRSPSPSPIYT